MTTMTVAQALITFLSRQYTVDGDIQLFSNRGRFKVKGNVVDGNLQCKSNKPKPRGSGNVVEGDKENQCRSM